MIEVGSKWRKKWSTGVATVLEVNEYNVRFEIYWAPVDGLGEDRLTLTYSRILFEAYFTPVPQV